MSHLWCLSFSASSGGWEIRYHSAKHPIATKTPPTTSQKIQNTVEESSKKDATRPPVLIAKIAEATFVLLLIVQIFIFSTFVLRGQKTGKNKT